MTGRATRRVGVAVLALWLLATLALPSVITAAEPATFEAIDRYVEERMDASRVPGLALSIVAGDEVVHQRGFGHTSEDGAINPQTPFFIGSASKSITALAVMQLVEAGRVDLDAPVQHYIPWFTLADAGAAERITVRHLLTMTSGIPASAGGEAFRSTVSMTPEEAVRALSSVPLAAEPGTTFAYVNANYVTLGLIIETTSGQAYGDYVKEHIFDPLEMRDTYTDPTQVPGGIPAGHRYWFGVPVSHEMPYLPALVPAGYVISTADDLSRYLTMYLNGGVYDGRSIISPDGLAELHRPAVSAALGPWANGAPAHYAMGWYVGGPWGDQSTIFHPGSEPTFSAMLLLDPVQGLGVVTLINASTEMPLPGAAGEMRYIPSGIMSLLLDEEPAGSIGLARFYLIFDLAVLAIVAIQIAALVRVVVRGKPSATPGRGVRIARFGVPLIWEIGLPLAILALPGLMAMSWRSLWLWNPDIAVVLVTIGSLWLATALVRLVLIGRALRGGSAVAVAFDQVAPQDTRRPVA
jgi:CubicO group peptidase (beta-lactamase class C family)